MRRPTVGLVVGVEGRVEEVENVWLDLPDGTLLATRLWLPAGASPARRVPVVLEYLPYRKRDVTRPRDALAHPWMAAHGIAGARVDLRGSGESGGLLDDEYSPEELADAVHVVAWLARQPWCNGSVGMMGNSWGGFNSLQVAALRPPALRAVVSLCSTDDRYADDVHYMGGALLSATFVWAMVLAGFTAFPPDPAILRDGLNVDGPAKGGDGWRAAWRRRVEAMPLYLEPWVRHARRDAYWKHGSVCDDYAAIACPVFAVGGWTDGYTNAIPRLLAGLSHVPRQALVGPWAHGFPHATPPGPAGGFLQEALAWWNRWLFPPNNNNDDDSTPSATATTTHDSSATPPMLRAWVLESVRPKPIYDERPGRWVVEETWPPRDPSPPYRLYLTQGRLAADKPSGPIRNVAVRTPQHLGGCGGDWCPFGLTPDDAEDQQEDDLLSVVWDTQPLEKRLEILGAPLLHLNVSVDAPIAHLIVRLCDVHPDGASLRVTYGVLNLCHRESHEAPVPLEPGRTYAIQVQLNDVAFAFPPGHRIRVAISTTYWPVVWPSPYPATVTISESGDEEAAVLLLPQREPRKIDDEARVPPAECAPPEPQTVLRRGTAVRERGRDIGTGEYFWRSIDTPDRMRLDAIGTETECESNTEYRIRPDDPLSARIETVRKQLIVRDGLQTRTVLHATMSADSKNFRLTAHLETFEADALFCQRDWDVLVPRDYV